MCVCRISVLQLFLEYRHCWIQRTMGSTGLSELVEIRGFQMLAASPQLAAWIVLVSLYDRVLYRMGKVTFEKTCGKEPLRKWLPMKIHGSLSIDGCHLGYHELDAMNGAINWDWRLDWLMAYSINPVAGVWWQSTNHRQWTNSWFSDISNAKRSITVTKSWSMAAWLTLHGGS